MATAVVQLDIDRTRPILAVEGVWKSFAALTVLAEVTFQVTAGEVVALIGPSGSGKTTLLRCIDLLEPIDRGKITVAGELMGFHRSPDDRLLRDSEQETTRKRLALGMVSQRFHLFRHMTALQNVMEGLRTVKRLPVGEARSLALDQLSWVGLVDKSDAYPAKLSGGQQQRVAIARALAMHPRIMLFDEPTSALDPELSAEVLAVMRRLADDGMTMLVVTHEMSFAREVADRVLMFHSGRVVEDGPPERIFSAPSHEATRTFLAKVR